MYHIRNIAPMMMTLVFLSSLNAIEVSAKPMASVTNQQLKGKITQDSLLTGKPDLKAQQPKVDPAPQLTGKIKRHALWDAYEHTLSKTDDRGRVPTVFLNIQTVFQTLKNPKVDEGTKRFLSFLVKNWGTFTSNEDPPPIDLTILGENIWAVAEQSIPLTQKENAAKMPNKSAYFIVDANWDGTLTREELVNAIKELDAVPNDLKRQDGRFNYYRVRATLGLLLDSFDMFDAQTNKDEYKYL